MLRNPASSGAAVVTVRVARFTVMGLVVAEKSSVSLPALPYTSPLSAAALLAKRKVLPALPPNRLGMLRNEMPATAPWFGPEMFQVVTELGPVRLLLPPPPLSKPLSEAPAPIVKASRLVPPIRLPKALKLRLLSVPALAPVSCQVLAVLGANSVFLPEPPIR